MEGVDEIEKEGRNLQYRRPRARVLTAVYVGAFETRIRLWHMLCNGACHISTTADLSPATSLPQIPVFDQKPRADIVDFPLHVPGVSQVRCYSPALLLNPARNEAEPSASLSGCVAAGSQFESKQGSYE